MNDTELNIDEYERIVQLVIENTMLYETDIGDVSIKEYLKTLLKTLWEEQEEFSGKRPFGNSDWWCDLYKGLVRGGLVEGQISKWGDLDEVNYAKADKIIKELIDNL